MHSVIFELSRTLWFSRIFGHSICIDNREVIMNSKKVFYRIGVEKLGKFGYEPVELPQFRGSRTYFLRKELKDNIFVFIAFHQYMYVNVEVNGEQLPREFDFRLWRNYGETPRQGYNPSEKNMQNWLYLSLPQLLWFVLHLKIYDGPNYIWKYHDEVELADQLGDAFEKTIEYGIPWLEDPESKNPY